MVPYDLDPYGLLWFGSLCAPSTWTRLVPYELGPCGLIRLEPVMANPLNSYDLDVRGLPQRGPVGLGSRWVRLTCAPMDPHGSDSCGPLCFVFYGLPLPWTSMGEIHGPLRLGPL